MRILQIANYREGVGGIAVQVKLLHEHLVAEGFDCAILSTKGSVPKRIIAIIQLLIKGKHYDVFHIHACSGRGFFPAVAGVLAGRILKKRIVLTFHGGGADSFFKKRTTLVKYILSKTDHNIVLSGFIGQIYDKYGIGYIIIPNIVEMDEDHFRNREKICPKFISTRSLTSIYNISCTIDAFKMVKEQFPEAKLDILGDGPLRQQMESYVIDNGISNVSFVGRVDNSSIYRYLDNADIFISSSLFDNMPVSILEGFNAGLLVIASNVGGVPYLVEDNGNGLLFNPENPSELAKKIIWALLHQTETKALIKNAYGSVKKYSWPVIKHSLLPLYI